MKIKLLFIIQMGLCSFTLLLPLQVIGAMTQEEMQEYEREVEKRINQEQQDQKAQDNRLSKQRQDQHLQEQRLDEQRWEQQRLDRQYDDRRWNEEHNRR